MISNFKFTSILLTVCLFALLYSCKSDQVPNATDATLLKLAKNTSGFVWYNLTDTLLPHSSGSGHGQPFLRTRYNAIAATQLDVNGRVIPGSLFPEGSLIVKELYLANNVFDRYAILYKDSDSESADAQGWVWGYINADETVAVAASLKGSSCIACHSQVDNIDYMLMNKYFP